MALMTMLLLVVAMMISTLSSANSYSFFYGIPGLATLDDPEALQDAHWSAFFLLQLMTSSLK